jgi:hypothetical protein
MVRNGEWSGTGNGQGRWTVREVGRSGKLDGQGSWTVREVGRSGKLDGQGSWTVREVGRSGKLDDLKRLQNHVHVHVSKTKETLNKEHSIK